MLTKICPLCGFKNKKKIIVANEVYGDKEKKRKFFLCENCDVRYMQPRLTKLQEKKFYKKEFEVFMSKRSGASGGWLNADNHVKKNYETFQRRRKYLEKYSPKKNKMNICEFGCSSGFMLYPLKKKGHECYGVEPSGFFENYLKKKGIKLIKAESFLKKNNLKFDLITHFFVLEHISDPISFLKNQLNSLKKGGKIIFEIPNVSDPLHTLYNIREFERFYWSIAHPWYFNHKSLSYLLKKLKKPFKILLDQRYDWSNHLTWMIEGKPGGMKKYSKLLGSKLEKNYIDNLYRRKKCDTLVGIITNN